MKEALYHYVLGHSLGDAGHFQRAFHERANLYWVRDGQLMTRSDADYAAAASGPPAEDELRRRRRVVS